jgi:hypothetical protein
LGEVFDEVSGVLGVCSLRHCFLFISFKEALYRPAAMGRNSPLSSVDTGWVEFQALFKQFGS